jgi:deferrochelatase/peroxidase EfeB
VSLPLSEIQGFVLRGYAMPALRVFVLEIAGPEGARRFLGSLVSGTQETTAALQLTTAAHWTSKPDYCVNLGLTYQGLVALELPPTVLATFPEEFIAGAAARAERVGDIGESAPAYWKGGLGSSRVHALLFLFAQNEAIIDRASETLRAAFGAGGACAELSCHDARALPGNVTHFGYRDGFAQPTIEGGLPSLLPDVLPEAPAGEFVLGHPSQYAGFTYPVPADIGLNGSFAAFRVLEQNCDAFEAFLDEAARNTGLDRELIAAKLCGRWRNGIPLALSPLSPDSTVPPERYNSFDYVPTTTLPDAYDDRRGYRCPIGAHVRRMNPRHSAVAGNSGLKRRIVRRGLPYGPPHDPSRPHDGQERGLLGLFIGVSLKDQFEFLMSDWANKGTFAPGLRDTRDPILGDNSSTDAKFLVPIEGRQPLELTGLTRFVVCRGAAYAFLPSASAIRYLSTLG